MYDTALLLVLAYTMWVIDRKQIGIEKHWYPKLVFKAIRPLLLTEQPHSQLHSDPEIKGSFKKYFCKKFWRQRIIQNWGLLWGYPRLTIFLLSMKSTKELFETKRTTLVYYVLWHYWLWSFNTRDTKLERFLHKNQHAQRKLLNFENWTNGSLSSLKNQSWFFWFFMWKNWKTSVK